MGRILAIDYGRRRTGLAVTDPAQIIPGGLTTVATGELLKFLDDYMKRETVERVVVGWPTQTSGQPSENQQRVAEFVRAFERRHPDVPVVKQDERFTSVIAHRTMIDAGLSRKRRQDKALVDEISATLILQQYMDGR
ncbi:MAG: Holliday junction resolvase RuvX [Prevotellamassilia sp.]|nr:Holliday junction resolvase RuvX [Prevotellamassilia sp.]MCI6144608.1 Holliday junction resolvase RuvX [Bacteroidales bacterium]MDY2623413.1 Holliday junction resolvase RuvX [Alloprevotella sp.]MDD7563901.1 Holliday junction resolvase RuvX [Prevotellamassilia sp.]MDY4567711.1 Holliday junction resolvase RuvX [Alloprevotella sp.]